ncbi:MAG TPA: hypothetical protein DCO77_03895 [Nitrospiraceae bacterium]|nr:hypothetical protein [Nitrospiraceae bacterium]
MIQQVLDKNPKNVKFVVKHFPLRNHKFAKKASIAALAAHKQGKFWEYHHKIFQNMRSLSDAKLQDIAKEVSLNIKKFNRDMKNPAIQKLIMRDMNEGNRAGLRGTPTIYVNGKLLKSRGFQGFQQMIDEALKKK